VSGVATAASSSTRRCPAMRATVAGSNSPASPLSTPVRPSPVRASASVRSKASTPVSTSKRAAGTSSNTSRAWNRGARSKSRAGLSARTSRPKGSAWCSHASRIPSRTLPSSVRKVGSPSSRVRSTSGFSNGPTASSTAGWERPGAGKPTHTSSCPE